MTRLLLNLLTVLSLLLCVAIVGLWAQSYRKPYAHPYDRKGPVYCEVRSERGKFISVTVKGPRPQRQAWSWLLVGDPPRPRGTFYPAAGEVYGFGPLVIRTGMGSMSYGATLAGPDVASGLPYRFVAIAYWLPALVTAMLPAAWMIRRGSRRRARRQAMGLCPACGYDLRATPGRCPECGTIP
jgi:hypothetical protein